MHQQVPAGGYPDPHLYSLTLPRRQRPLTLALVSLELDAQALGVSEALRKEMGA